MEAQHKLLVKTPDCEIVSSRKFHTKRETVFKCWINPEHLKNWWGPNGFTNTFHEFDLRPGGKWGFIMHGPDKKDYPNESVFLKIEEPSFLAWDHISKPVFQINVHFEESEKETTLVTFKMIFNTPEECAKLKGFVPEKNEENFDRLEVELKKVKELHTI